MKLFVLISFTVLVAVVQGQDLACYSGQIVNNSACIVADNAALCNFTAPNELETSNPPSILQQRLRSADNVILTIIQSFTSSRQVISIKLSNKALCNYPGSNWIKGVNLAGSPASCLDNYAGSIPWSEFYNTSASDQMEWGCGVELDNSDPDVVIYRGEVTITWQDTIQIQDSVRPFNITRESSAVLQYQLEYPKQISIQASATEVSEPRLLSAVTEQSYNSSSDKLEIHLITSVQTPYRLNSIQSGALPSLISSVQLLSSDCSNGSSPCVQQWSIELSRTNPKCDFNGIYNFTFSTGCQSSVNCALDETEIIKYIAFSLNTGDVCGTVSDVTTVTAQLTSHGNFISDNGTFSNARNAFLPTQKVYFQLRLSSDSAALAGSSIQSVTATDLNGVEQSLVSAGVAQIASYATQLVSASSVVRVHELEFQFESAWYGTLAPDQIASSTLTVTASLNFNSGKRQLAKYAVRAADEHAKAFVQVSLMGVLPGQNEPEIDSSSSSVTPTIIALVISLFALIV